MNIEKLKYLVVGSGFSGAVVAERIANDLGEDVLVVDKRDHFGGNCFSKIDSGSGVEFHVYGSHIFHTANEKVWAYVNQFTEFNNYKHQVLAKHKNKLFSMPINLSTINSFYQREMDPEEARVFLDKEIKKSAVLNPTNLEEKAISLVGKSLYEAFVKGYTQKQWETDPKQLPAHIITRLPIRYNYDNRYFSDPHEGIPMNGYNKIFERMLSNPKISLKLGVDFFDLKKKLSRNTVVVYTGPIDKYFDYQFGMLGWRTLKFETEVKNVADFQGTSVINYSDSDVAFTRIHEFKHFHPEREYKSGKTFISREFSSFASKDAEPYYPIGTEEDKFKLALYQAETKKIKNTFFVGRLGSYKYMDMHQAIGAALLLYEKELRPKITGQPWKPKFTYQKT
jgi:UDP-galactopyranose mutase